MAAIAAVLLGLGWLIGRAGYNGADLALELTAVAVAAFTFVPDALRNLRHGRIGVGILMTIAAIGAVASGQLDGPDGHRGGTITAASGALGAPADASRTAPVHRGPE